MQFNTVPPQTPPWAPTLPSGAPQRPYRAALGDDSFGLLRSEPQVSRHATPPSPPRLRPPASPVEEELAGSQVGFAAQTAFVPWIHPSILARRVQAHAAVLVPLLAHWRAEFATQTLDHLGAQDLLAALADLAAPLAQLDGLDAAAAVALMERANGQVHHEVAQVPLPTPAVLRAPWALRQSLSAQATFVGLGLAFPGLPAAMQAARFGSLDGTCAPLRQALAGACTHLAPLCPATSTQPLDLALVPAARRAVRKLSRALSQALLAHPL